MSSYEETTEETNVELTTHEPLKTKVPVDELEDEVVAREGNI